MQLMMAALAAVFVLAAGTTTVEVGNAVCGVLDGGKYLYADTYNDGTLVRIDPAENKVVRRIHVSSSPCGMARGAGAVWVEDFTTNWIYRVDEKTLKVKPVRVGRKPWDVAFAFGSVWASNQLDGTVSRVSPKTRKAVKTIDVGTGPTCTRAGLGALWVGTQSTDDIWRVDPATNSAKRVPVGHGGEICADPNSDGIWVANNNDGSVSRLDPSSLAVTATVPVCGNPTDLVRGPDGLEWIACNADGKVVKVDPRSAKVVDEVATGGRPFVIRSAFGSVWTGDFRGTKLFRLTP